MSIKEFMKTICIGIVTGLIFLLVMFGAIMQESYKLYPPTDEEIQENAYLQKYR